MFPEHSEVTKPCFLLLIEVKLVIFPCTERSREGIFWNPV